MKSLCSLSRPLVLLPSVVAAFLLVVVVAPRPAGAGGVVPDVEPVEAAQVAKYLPLIQQIEAIERIKAIQHIKSQQRDSVPPFLPIVLALHHKSQQQKSGKKKLRLLSLFS
ncbi:uncharacterized protein LOC144111057 [Amblyomma americanum]